MMIEFPKKLFLKALNELGFSSQDSQVEKVEKYFHLLMEWNQKTNLTAITQPEEVVLKHFVDSLTCLPYLKASHQKMIDVGTGPGFPGLPLKIFLPSLKLVLVESNNKKIKFLEAVVQKLDLSHVELLWKRVEEVGQDPKHREAYDVMVSRALAPLPVILEYGLPLLKIRGTLLAMKSQKSHQEILASPKALLTLGGEIELIKDFELPCLKEPRRIVLVTKVKATPSQYPRRPGIPSKQPL